MYLRSKEEHLQHHSLLQEYVHPEGHLVLTAYSLISFIFLRNQKSRILFLETLFEGLMKLIYSWSSSRFTIR